jgi:hypothetical protein
LRTTIESDNDTYRNSWRFDAATKRYLGNPARSAKVDGMLKAIKNKNGERERHHSRAMSVEDMEQMHKYRTRRMEELRGKTDRKSCEERVRLSMYGAFSVVAFTIWTRYGSCSSCVGSPNGNLFQEMKKPAN